MKNILWAMLIIASCCHVFGQEGGISYLHEPEDDPEEEIISIRQKQAWAQGFTQTLNKIGDPSIASFFGTDKTFNRDPARQKKDFILNTTIQPVVGIGGKRWYIKNYVHSFQIVPSITIRIFQNDSTHGDHSMPVRTPGFTSRFNYYFSHARLWNDTVRHKLYFGATLAHSSNGQDAYEFKIDIDKMDSLVNTYNGNFSELAIFEFMMGGLKSYNRKIPPEALKTKNGFLRRMQFDSRNALTYWKLAYEYHPRSFTTEKYMRYHLYGRKRLNIQLGHIVNPVARPVVYSRSRERWIPLEKEYHSREIRRLVVNFSYILDGRYNVSRYVPVYQEAPLWAVGKRMNIDFTWYERLGTTSDFAVFMRVGYYGSDPYNVYFQESLYVARIGISFGNFVFGEKK